MTRYGRMLMVSLPFVLSISVAAVQVADEEASSAGLPKRRTTTQPADDIVDADLVEELLGGRSTARDSVETTLLKMKQTAERLSDENDMGRKTLRMQKQILDGIDAMIETAEKTASSSQQKSKSRRASARPSKGTKKETTQGRKSAAKDSSKQGTGTQETDPKAADKKGTPSDRTDLARRWGFLPDQDRDEVMQGLDEAFMPKYREEITRYYRNLAIEAAKE